MTSTRIKISSNPYAEQICFYRLSDEWVPISQATDPKSKLLSRKLSSGFFPFKAQVIVDTIVAEFQAGDQVLEIEFEGPDDEYEELCAICASGKYSSITRTMLSGKYLPNARDVLPDIIALFKEIRPLIDDAVMERESIRDSLDKFIDVSSDLIPLCVLGNYSAGKSTFINALIGQELLPNGDEPVTAKVYQIKRSQQWDAGCIKFGFGETPIVLHFDSKGLRNAADLIGIDPYDEIASKLKGAESSLIPQMNCALQAINDFRQNDASDNISDRVDIEVPFAEKDTWGRSNGFVIFDTPGSNASSHLDHLRVLKEAMAGMSNGLPIVVAAYDTLDSMDNEKLYNDIATIKAMDERFAMIVVNKADAATLPRSYFDEEQVQTVMDWTIPRNMYAQGIFFVSSILGLGAKTGGVFIGDSYAEKYEDQERKYSNPENKFYKQLYRYNIMPGQMRERIVAESEGCADLVFANSGLYCIEREIDLFAEKYSAYNKCHQSELLLAEMISATREVMESVKADRERSLKERKEALDKDKRDLLDFLRAKGKDVQNEAIEAYLPHMQAATDTPEWSVTEDELAEREANITGEKRSDLSYSDQEEAVRESWQSISDNVSRRFSEAVEKPSFEAFGRILTGIADDLGEFGKQVEIQRSLATEADCAAADELLSLVREGFNVDTEEILTRVNSSSQKYWREAAEAGREALYRIATNNEVLSEEKRAEVGEIIIRYQPLVIEGKADKIFVKSELENSFKLFNFVIIKSEKLNLSKLARVYNDEIERFIAQAQKNVKIDHERLYKNWLAELLALIIANITDYNPMLHTHMEVIREETLKINELTAKLARLQHCSKQVAQMIDWKERA